MDGLNKKLALGTVQFGLDYGISNSGGKTSEEDVVELLTSCWSAGITMLDTAQNYGDSENVIGNASSFPFDVISKFSTDHKSVKGIKQSASASLEKLKIERLYGFLSHDADTFINQPELWEAMEELKSDGVILKAGYSLYTPLQLNKLLDSNIVPDIIQVPYNLFDKRFEPFFKDLKSMGVEIHTRSVFLQGLFFIDAENLSSHFDLVRPYLKQLQNFFKKQSDMAAWLLQHVLKEINIDKVVFGVNNAHQLESNLLALKKNHFPVFDNICTIPDQILLPFLWPKNSK